MKKIILKHSMVLAAGMLLTQISFAQGIGINSTGADPHSSAGLDVDFNNKGLLPPRMTHAQRASILNPAAGLIIWCTDCGIAGEMQVFNGTTWTNMVGGTATAPFTCGTSTVTFTYNGASVTYGTVSRAYGGAVGTKCWLDRNLGATQVAASSNDHLAYGDLFQWGRGADGHQRITWTNATTGTAVNGTTGTLSSTDTPGNNTFITNGSSPNDWRNPQNNSLWQGVSGANNPCPSGYRLPTEPELQAECSSWTGGNNAAGAFASPLKLPRSGYRFYSNGSFSLVGTLGLIWSSTVSGSNSGGLEFSSSNSNAGMYFSSRAYGGAVRCIKD